MLLRLLLFPFRFVRFLFAFRRSQVLYHERKQDTRELPMPELVAHWARTVATALPASMQKLPPVLSPGAAPEIVALAERRLNCALPQDLKEFYAVTNGVRRPDDSNYLSVLAVEALEYCRVCDPMFEQRLNHELADEIAKNPSAARGVEATTDSLVDMLGNVGFVVDIASLNDMLCLEPPKGRVAVLIVVHPHPNLPYGAVLQVEGIYATWFPDFRAWVSSDAAMHARFADMAARRKRR